MLLDVDCLIYKRLTGNGGPFFTFESSWFEGLNIKEFRTMKYSSPQTFYLAYCFPEDR